jgi:hypothetical protein
MQRKYMSSEVLGLLFLSIVTVLCFGAFQKTATGGYVDLRKLYSDMEDVWRYGTFHASNTDATKTIKVTDAIRWYRAKCEIVQKADELKLAGWKRNLLNGLAATALVTFGCYALVRRPELLARCLPRVGSYIVGHQRLLGTALWIGCATIGAITRCYGKILFRRTLLSPIQKVKAPEKSMSVLGYLRWLGYLLEGPARMIEAGFEWQCGQTLENTVKTVQGVYLVERDLNISKLKRPAKEFFTSNEKYRESNGILYIKTIIRRDTYQESNGSLGYCHDVDIDLPMDTTQIQTEGGLVWKKYDAYLYRLTDQSKVVRRAGMDDYDIVALAGSEAALDSDADASFFVAHPHHLLFQVKQGLSKGDFGYCRCYVKMSRSDLLVPIPELPENRETRSPRKRDM